MEKLERNFGIISNASDHEGFFGIIKQRFSDFQVNEVSSSGEIIHLTSEEVVEVPSIKVSNKSIGEKPPEITDAEIEFLKVLSGQKLESEVLPSALVDYSSSEKCLKPSTLKEKLDNPTHLEVVVSEMSKERRKAVHEFVKTVFPNLCSSTKDNGSQKVISITKKDSVSKKDKRDTWSKDQSHVTFVLYKENIDTVEAVNILAAKLRKKIKPGMFCYAGTKDRRAKTSQLVSLYQVEPKEIVEAAKQIPRIKVGNFSFCKKPQSLGQSRGNHFRIVVRSVDATDEELKLAVESFKERGFINYFGMQRFSSTEISTHTIGKALLKGNWKEAVDLILCKRENDFPDVSKAKLIWCDTKNAAKALKSLPSSKRGSIEGLLLSGLDQHGGKNFLNALEKIPRNVKLMYTHAYQSYIWNIVVSKRIEKYKLKVLPGDLVRKKRQKGEIQSNEKCSSVTVEGEAAQEDENGKVGDDAAVEPFGLEMMEGDEVSERGTRPESDSDGDDKSIRVVKEGEVDAVDITEVVMPLPGFNIEYPENEMRSWYEECLKQDGLSFETLKTKVKTFSLGGAYRKIIVRPQNLQWETCYYNDSNLPLIQSDLEAMNKQDIDCNKLSSGSHKALILEFTLSTSSYATVALRELMKIDTSSKYQSSLTANAAKSSKREMVEDENSEKNKKMKPS